MDQQSLDCYISLLLCYTPSLCVGCCRFKWIRYILYFVLPWFHIENCWAAQIDLVLFPWMAVVDETRNYRYYTYTSRHKGYFRFVATWLQQQCLKEVTHGKKPEQSDNQKLLFFLSGTETIASCDMNITRVHNSLQTGFLLSGLSNYWQVVKQQNNPFNTVTVNILITVLNHCM